MAEPWTRQRLVDERLVRYSELRPCLNAFIDTRSPGSDRKENFTIIGPGVAEHPDQHVHIGLPHGFNIGGARQPPGCLNSQHSHETAEVFIVHSGRWAFRWGERGEDGEVILEPGDVISLPVHMFRGFENVGEDVGYLFAILGGDDPGHVTWAPYVFDMAKEYGLVLLEDGQLVDTTVGEQVPPGKREMPVTTAEQIAALHCPSDEEMQRCVLRAAQFDDTPGSVISRAAEPAGGVREFAVIGQASPAEDLPEARFGWPHGFSLRRLLIAPGARVPAHVRAEEEVLFVQSGALLLRHGGEEIAMDPGDVFSVPVGIEREFVATGEMAAEVFVVRRGDCPQAPSWRDSA